LHLRFRSAVWLLVIAAAAFSCSSDDLTLPNEGLPAALAVVSGGAQTAVVATPLPDSLLVRVTDSKSRPVEGIKVAFTPLLGGGDAVPDTGVTNADGRTGIRWILGSTAGAQRMQAMVTGETSSGALTQNFDATALAAAADTVFSVRGNNQSAEVGGPLADSLVVRITDRFGNSVSGAMVTWGPTGGGSVSPSSGTTGSAGTAATRRTLGPTAGPQGATATASSLKGSPVVFAMTALPAAPTSLVKVTGDNQSGAVSIPLTDSVVVRLLDASGNGVPGRNVTFAIATGSGTVSPVSATTDAGGRAAARWTLGPIAGSNSLIATSSGFSVTFQATGNSAAATTLLSNSPVTQNGTAGLPASSAPSVRVTDANGNPVAGVAITFAVSGGGGSILPVTPISTNASGIATLTQWVLGTVAGSNTVTASAAGLTPSLLTFSATGAAGSAAQLQVQTQPSSSAQSGVALAIQPTVRLADVFGNPVTTSGTTVTAALALGTGTLGGTLTANTVSGLATFTNLSITGPSGTYAIRFTSGSLTPDTTAAITIGAGVASRLVMVTQPSTTAQNAVAFAQQPRVRVQDAAGNSVAGVRSVTVAINAGGGTLGGTATINSDATGLATFAGLSITGATGNRTLVFSSAGLTSIVSGTVALTAGAPTQMAVNAGNAQTATAGSAVAIAPSVVVRDVSSNPVPGVAVTFAVASGGGSVLPVAAVTTNASGIAAATSWTLGPAAGANSLTATAAPGGITPNPVTFTATAVAGGAGRLGMVTQPPATATNGVAFTQAPVVQLQDVNGNPVTTAGIAVSVAIASGSGTLNGPPTQATDASGRATFTGLSITGLAGPFTLQFTGASLTGVTSAPVTLSAGAANRLTITTQPPVTAQSGVVMTATVVQVQDVSGNLVSASTATVTAAIASGGGALTGTLSTAAVAGVATFSNLIITGTIGARTLRFTSGSLVPDTSTVVTLAAGNAASVAFVQEPTAVVAGAAITPSPSVRVQDGAGNLVTSPAQTVALTISTNPGGATLSGTASVATVSGLATFPGLSLNRSGTGYRLRAVAGALVPDTSVAFNVTAAAATTIAANSVTAQTDTAGLTVAAPPSVLVTDAGGNPVAGVAVTFAVTGGGGSILPVTPVTTNAAGVATLTSWTLGNAAGANTVTATSAGLTPSLITFNATGVAGVATQLVIQTQPSGAAQSGVAFAIQPAVRLADVFGNTVPTSGTVLTAALATGTGTLGGTLTASTTTGVATFTNLSITGATGAYTVRFTSGALTPDTTTAITIGAGAATKLVMGTQPSTTAVNGVAFAVQPTVQLQDVANNPVAQAGVVITAAISTGGGTLGGTLTATTNAGGLATFTNLSITGTVGARTLLFTSTGLTQVVSGTVTTTAGAAIQIAVNAGNGQTATVNTAVTTPLSVLVRDVNLNPVAGVSVTFAVAGGGGSILPVAPVVTNASGIAALTSWTLGTVAGANSVTATAAGLTGSPLTFTATGNAGAATQLVIQTQPSAAAQSGVAFAVQPAVRLGDAFGNLVNTGGTVLTAALATGTGTLGGTLTASTVAGVATFTNLSITGVSGAYTVRFTSGALTPDTTTAITIGAGAAARLGMVVQPSDTAQNAIAFPRQPQVQVQDAAGNPVAGVASVTATIFSGGGSLLGTATLNTNAAGLATFTNLAIVGTVGARTLRFASGALTVVNSAPVLVTAGAPKLIAVSAGNGQTATAGAAVAIPPGVLVSDTSGNPVPGVAVTFAVAGGGGSVLPATAVTTGAGGIAAATSWTLGTTAGANSLTATAAPAGIAANPVTFTATAVAGGAGRLAMFTQPPASAASGAVLSAPVVQLQDVNGNPVATANVGITASIASGPGGVLGGGTVALTDLNGRAAFSTLTITGPTGAYTLQFGGASLTGVTSSGITLTAGAPARVAVITQPTTTQSGVAFPVSPTVQVQDIAGNAVAAAGRSVVVSAQPGSAALTGTLTQATSGSGLATFPGLVLTGTVGPSTLLFSSAGLTSDTTAVITLTPGNASSLQYVQQPSTVVAGQAIAPSPTVRIRDGAGNTVTSATNIVTLALVANPGASTLGGTTSAAAVAGVATFNTLTLNKTGVGYTLGATSSGLTGVTSSSFTVNAGTATALALTSQPTTGQSGAVLGTPLVVRLVDVNGNTVPTTGVIVTAALASGPGALSGSITTGTVSGVATFTNLVLTGTTGSYSLNLSAPTLTSITTGTITLSAGAPTALAYLVQPTDVAAGVAIAPAVTVRILDGAGNFVPTATNTVSMGLGANPGGSSLGGTVSVAAVAGVATFSTLTLDKTGAGYTLTASSGGLTAATSAGFAVTPGAASRVVFLVQPTTATAGAAISPPVQVEIQDANGNRVTGSTAAVTVALGANPGASTLSGTTTINAVAGVATFSTLSLNRTGTGYTLGASSGALTGATSAAFNINPGVATALAITTAPTTGQSGVVLSPQPVIRLVDANGNTVPSNSVTITAALASGSGTLGGVLTALTTSGVASFSNLALSGTAGSYTLNFGSGGLTSVTSGTIALSAGTPAALAFLVQPSTVTAGALITPAVQVRVVDGAGNTVTTATNSVTLSLAANPGGSAFGGTLTTAAVGGVATFSTLTLDRAASGYTLGAAATGLTSATSTAFTVNPGTAAALVINAAPTTAQSGVVLAPQPAVRLVDALGNTVPTTGTTVTAALASGAGTLGGTLTANTVSGVATFTNLVLTGTIGNYTLTFTGPSVTGVTTGPIAVAAGVPAAVAYLVQPGTVVAGASISPAVQVRLIDGAGNTVTTATNTVTVALGANPGSSTLGGPTSAAAVAGVATFGSLTLNRSAAGYTLTAASTGLTGATSSAFTVNPGNASALAITTAPATAQSGVVLSPQPVIRLVDANGNTVPTTGTVITAALASGTGALEGTLTANTASGIATFTDLTLTGTVGNYTISFTSGALTAATTGAIAVSAGVPAALGFVVQPVTTAAGSSIPAPQVEVRDGAGNRVITATTSITLGLGNNPGSSTLSGTATVGAVAGVATFPGLSLNRTGAAYTLTANGGALPQATSAAFDITPGTPASLAFTVQPSTVVAGASIAPAVQVEVRDASGNRVTASTASVTVAIGTNPAGGTLSGTATANAVAGVATFNNLSINRSGVGYTLAATSGILTAAGGSAFTVDPGAASALAITTMPTSGTTGVALTPAAVIRLIDANGNTVPTTGTSVTALLSTGSGTLGGTTSASTTSGVATFNNLILTGLAGPYALNFSSGVLTSVTSGTITLGAGAASAIAANSAPAASGTVGTAVTPLPSVRVTDGSGNPVSGVGVTFAATAGNGSITGGAATTDVNGVATVGSWTRDLVAGADTLTATSAGLAGSPVRFTTAAVAGAASTIAANSVASQSATVGTAVGAPPSVIVRDASNNPVAGVNVTFAVTGGGGSILPVAAVTTNASGIATLTSWTLGPVAGANTVTATGAGTLSGNPVLFTATGTAGAATQIALNAGNSQSATVGTAVSTPLSVVVRDASSNPVAGVNVTFAVTGGGGSLGAPAVVATNAGGIATAPTWTLGTTAGTNTVTATGAGTLSGNPVLFTATGAAGPATQLTIITQPSSSATSGLALAQQPTVQVQDAFGNPVAGVVSISVTLVGAGTLGGTTPIATDPGGLATFTDLVITGAAGSYSLDFAASGLAPASSIAITIP
jgi:hypothetical protein